MDASTYFGNAPRVEKKITENHIPTFTSYTFDILPSNTHCFGTVSPPSINTSSFNVPPPSIPYVVGNKLKRRCNKCLQLTMDIDTEYCENCDTKQRSNQHNNQYNQHNNQSNIPDPWKSLFQPTFSTGPMDVEKMDKSQYKMVGNNTYIKKEKKKAKSIKGSIKESIPIKFYLDKNALEAGAHPKKNNPTDSGYDLSILSVEKKIDSMTTMYDTGVRVVLPEGYYCEVYPRSSISRLGYMLTNSVGVIDNSYSGCIKIVLTKINPDAPDIGDTFPYNPPRKFPLRVAQLIVRKLKDTTAEYYETESAGDALNTVRGDNGFGSSGFGTLPK